MSFRLSVRMEKLGSYWTGFYDILYLSIFLKCREIHVWLQSDKNNGYITLRRMDVYDNILLNSY
jgi:hypothetical protein